jgi:hypothetical protein
MAMFNRIKKEPSREPVAVAYLIEAGFTKADLTRIRQLNEVCNTFGFDTMMKAIMEANDRAERSTLRAMHRNFPPDEGG